MEYGNKLSADPSALVLGIIGLVLAFLGFCCGFFVVISLVLGIIGWVMAHKSLKEFQEHPEDFSYKSKNNVYTGKILSIISTILSALAITGGVIYFALYGGEFLNKFNEFYHREKQRQEHLKQDKDSTETKTVYKYEVDSVAVDSAAKPVK